MEPALAYQNVIVIFSGKGENIWDHLTHTNASAIKDSSNGDIAADSYHNYKRDVEMMRELGLDLYRFSISWSRILPTGFPNEINQAGIDYYNNYINEMIKYGIQPMATLYHWDLPQRLQDLGGWTNPYVSQWYEDYARVAFENFGDRIKLWITFNEPREICSHGYGTFKKAPLIDAQGVGDYMCTKNYLLSNAKAYHLYHNEFYQTQGGKIGVTINTDWFEALSESEDDLIAAELVRQGEWGQYGYPIFSANGGWPKELKDRVDAKSSAQGFPRSRIPELTQEEIDFIKGSADFYGINHYSASYVYSNDSVRGVWHVPSYYDDLEYGIYEPAEWLHSASSWLQLVPWSLYNSLMYIKENYQNPEIYITENGWSTHAGLEDDDRIQYYRAQWQGLLDAMDQGARVKGYMAWSLMDNFEWLEGYTERFGLYEVDFENPERTRTPRKSAFVYKQLIKTRTLDLEYEPTTNIMNIDEGH